MWMNRGLLLLVLMAVSACQAKPLIPADVEVVTIATGGRFTEGPALSPDGRVFYSDIPNNRVLLPSEAGDLTPTVVAAGTGGANGLMFDGDRLLGCAGRARAVKVIRLDRPATQPDEVIADRWQGKRFNGPNDLSIDPTGGFFFTDPAYGRIKNREIDVEGVYYVTKDGGVTQVIADLQRPNGIIHSPDFKRLYVADNKAAKVYVYDVPEPGRVENKRLFVDTAAQPEGEGTGPDGMTVDRHGRVYIALYNRGVLVVTPSGERIGFITTGRQTTNCTFGADGRTLYITADKGLKRVVLNVGD